MQWACRELGDNYCKIGVLRGEGRSDWTAGCQTGRNEVPGTTARWPVEWNAIDGCALSIEPSLQTVRFNRSSVEVTLCAIREHNSDLPVVSDLTEFDLPVAVTQRNSPTRASETGR